jgi:hypothetical protein
MRGCFKDQENKWQVYLRLRRSGQSDSADGDCHGQGHRAELGLLESAGGVGGEECV